MSRRDNTISKTIVRSDVLRREILSHCSVVNKIDFGNVEDNLQNGYYGTPKYTMPSDIKDTVYEALEHRIIASNQTTTIASMNANAICLKARIIQDIYEVSKERLGDWKRDANKEYLVGCIPTVQKLIWKEFDSRDVDYDDYISELKSIISFTISLSEEMIEAFKNNETV